MRNFTPLFRFSIFNKSFRYNYYIQTLSKAENSNIKRNHTGRERKRESPGVFFLFLSSYVLYICIAHTATVCYILTMNMCV